jgi:hypothetical protein
MLAERTQADVEASAQLGAVRDRRTQGSRRFGGSKPASLPADTTAADAGLRRLPMFLRSRALFGLELMLGLLGGLGLGPWRRIQPFLAGLGARRRALEARLQPLDGALLTSRCR